MNSLRFFLAASLLVPLAAAQTFDSTQLHIGTAPQLFVDNWVIESVQGVTRRWNQPVRHGEGPVLAKDQPWEMFPYFTYANYTVLRDPQDGLFKCWWEDACLTEPGAWPHRSRLLYAESRDGITWDKPALDIVRHEGRPTNIVAGHDFGHGSSEKNPWPNGGIHAQTIVLDPNPPTPDQRFRMILFLETTSAGRTTRRVVAAHSADGKHWRPYASRPTFGSVNSLGDVCMLWYDAQSGDFVMNTRYPSLGRVAWPDRFAMIDPASPAFGYTFPYAPHRPDLMNKRRIFQTRSHDFLRWTEPIELLCPDDIRDNLDEQYYGMGQFQVGRMHFGTLGVFRSVDNERDVRLVFSRDGVRWQHAARSLLLAPRGPGHWDAHMVAIAPAPIEVGDELWFYVGGTTGHHDYWLSGKENLDHPEMRDLSTVQFALGLARLRRDGFCSLDTSDVRPGVVGTRPVNSPGTTLLLNARCRPGGSIRITITDHNGKTLEGCELEKSDAFTGDSVRHTVTWAGRDAIPAPGTFRRVVFHLRKAEIFSFRLAETDGPTRKPRDEKLQLF